MEALPSIVVMGAMEDIADHRDNSFVVGSFVRDMAAVHCPSFGLGSCRAASFPASGYSVGCPWAVCALPSGCTAAPSDDSAGAPCSASAPCSGCACWASSDRPSALAVACPGSSECRRAASRVLLGSHTGDLPDTWGSCHLACDAASDHHAFVLPFMDS